MTEQSRLAYFDNAATSFPKPAAVNAAISDLLRRGAVSPGRSGFDLGLELGGLVDGVRAQLDRFVANPADDPNRCVFTANATDAINLALRGLCREGDHVVASVMDHNSVLRPLWMMREAGLITFDLAPADGQGRIDPADIAALLRAETRLVVTSQASNVCGAIQPVAEIGALCRERGIPFLLDAAQSAGVLPLDMGALGCDLLALTGHKGLLGPTGIGALIVGPESELAATRWGGTGVRSADRGQPVAYPYRLEAGTLNTIGIIGLGAALTWLREKGLAAVRQHETALANQFLAGVSDIAKVRLVGHETGAMAALGERHLPVVALNIIDRDPEEVGLFLDAEWNIAVRTGLHCAPLAHEALGTAPLGAVRFSFGAFNTQEQVARAVTAIGALAV